MILSILKVIGIIILIVLALIVLILGILLLVPVRYRFSLKYDETLNGNADVKWLPVWLKIFVQIEENQLRYTVRMFGGVILTNTEQKLSWLGKKIASSQEVQEEIDLQEDNHVEHENDVRKEEMVSSKEEIVEQKEVVNIPETEQGQEKHDDNLTEKKKQKRRTSDKNKKKKMSDKIKTIIEQLKHINDKKEKLLKVYRSKRFSVVKKDVMRYLKQLLRALRPDVLEGYVRFGLDDPASTGEIFGALAMALPLYYNFLVLEPDFQQKILLGNLKGKGKIRLISIVKVLIKVILNKNLIKVTKRVKTIVEM
ncbi:MAG: DUF2953 domain-containing protein [Eubacteriales bacterium]|nr:DUF2953 domain-containing protein [Eubacteriales bacterium]